MSAGRFGLDTRAFSQPQNAASRDTLQSINKLLIAVASEQQDEASRREVPALGYPSFYKHNHRQCHVEFRYRSDGLMAIRDAFLVQCHMAKSLIPRR